MNKINYQQEHEYELQALSILRAMKKKNSKYLIGIFDDKYYPMNETMNVYIQVYGLRGKDVYKVSSNICNGLSVFRTMLTIVNDIILNGRIKSGEISLFEGKCPICNRYFD